MLLEKELSEKNVYENIIEFGITNFEKFSSGVNKANEIFTNIYTDLSEHIIIMLIYYIQITIKMCD
jgi:hypothetical protein